MASGVYKIRNTINNHTYIGSAVDIDKRWSHHKRRLNVNKHHNRYLQRAWNKYGSNCFEFSVIEFCFPFFLTAREQFWIDSLCPEYNILPTAGSWLGAKHTDEARAKISASKTPEIRARMSAMKMGHPVSDRTRAAVSAARKNKKDSEETRAKKSKANKGHIPYNLGKKSSPEHRAKISAGLKGGKRSPETRARQSIAAALAWVKRREKYKK